MNETITSPCCQHLEPASCGDCGKKYLMVDPSAYDKLKAERDDWKARATQTIEWERSTEKQLRDELAQIKAERDELERKLIAHDEYRSSGPTRLLKLYGDLDNAVRALGELIKTGEAVLFALQCMIIKHNGEVPGLTSEQVFDGAKDARDKFKDALNQIKSLGIEVEARKENN